MLEIPAEIELPLERSRMERAFVNLIGNALEAMPDGGEVRITAELQDGVGGGARGGHRSGHRAGDPGAAVPALRERGQAERAGTGAGAIAADGAGSRRRYVGGIGAGSGARFSFRLPGAHVTQVQGQAVGRRGGRAPR